MSNDPMNIDNLCDYCGDPLDVSAIVFYDDDEELFLHNGMMRNCVNSYLRDKKNAEKKDKLRE